VEANFSRKPVFGKLGSGVIRRHWKKPNCPSASLGEILESKFGTACGSETTDWQQIVGGCGNFLSFLTCLVAH